MSAGIIDGKAIAASLLDRLAAEVSSFADAHGRRPAIRALLVGDNPASQAYVATKERMAAKIGIDSAVLRLPAATTESDLLARLAALNGDPTVDGILVQLPLSSAIDEERILNAVSPDKDVDGFHPYNVGRLFSAKGAIAEDLLVPCTPMGCLILLRHALPEGLEGRQAVVVGRSNIVGKPVAALLLAENCTVTIAHSRTRDLPAVCRNADILIAAVGRAEMIRGDWIRPGATVIDVGINRVPAADGKNRLVGDVAFAEAAAVAGAITPVPGGVGPMTVACLLRNTLVAARRRVGP